MKIVKGYPPNFKEIKKKFNLPKGVVFTFGDILYSPDTISIPEDLMVHENVHSIQQGDDPAKWWKEYFKDSQFRLDQEIKAYQNQYYIFKLNYKDRNEQARFLHKIASDLSGPIYGNIVSHSDAVQLIRGEK